MKSPIFGCGRNRRHRPKRKAINHPSAANMNMKGKKEIVASCGCCVCLNLRDKSYRRDSHRGSYAQDL